MRQFLQYWLDAFRLTKAQAFALFYRFIRFAAEEYVERGWSKSSSDEDKDEDI